jgi:hypothetical protein
MCLMPREGSKIRAPPPAVPTPPGAAVAVATAATAAVVVVRERWLPRIWLLRAAEATVRAVGHARTLSGFGSELANSSGLIRNSGLIVDGP